MAKGLKTFLIIILVVVIMAGLGYGAFVLFNKLNAGQTLSIVGYFDANGKELTSDSQSVVGGVAGVKFVKFQVTARNKDEVDLTFKIVDASPSTLFNALPIGEEVITVVDETVAWSSGLVDIEEYEGTTQEFTVVIEATSPFREPTRKTSSIGVAVSQDPQSEFDVVIDSEVNNDPDFPDGGDGDDIPPTEGTVSFRTTDLSYSSGSAIAFSESCGGELISYGYESTVTNGRSCATRTDFELPGVMPVPGEESNTWLFRDKFDMNEVFICWDRTSGSEAKRYDRTDSDATKVSNSLSSIDSTEEIFCN